MTATSTSTSRPAARSSASTVAKTWSSWSATAARCSRRCRSSPGSRCSSRSGNRSRLMLDIAGWRQARRAELTDLGTRTAKSVLESGESVRLRPMTPFERKVVHDAVARIRGRLQRERGRGAAAPGRHLPRCLTSPNPCSASGCRSPAGSPSTWRHGGGARPARAAGSAAGVGSARAELCGRRGAGAGRRAGGGRRFGRGTARDTVVACSTGSSDRSGGAARPAGRVAARGDRRSGPGARGGAGSSRGDRRAAALEGGRRGDRSRRRSTVTTGRAGAFRCCAPVGRLLA